MPFIPDSIRNKNTNQARPTIPSDKRLTSAEWRKLMDILNQNYADLLDLQNEVSLLSPIPFVRFNSDFTASSAGIYLFYGSTPRTLTISDDIKGLVEVRTIANVQLSLAGNINTNHLGIIYPGTLATRFRWDSGSSQYTF